MNITEIRVSCDYEYNPHLTINISYALVKFACTWLWVHEKRINAKNLYLSRLMNDQVSIINGVLFICGDDIIDTLQGGYVLGTLMKGHNKRKYTNEKVWHIVNP